MPLTRDRAICLRKLDYSETSQILALFSRTLGILRVIAKGAKRTTKAGHSKFDGGLDLLDVGEAVFIHSPEKELSALTEWTLVAGHLGLRDSLRGMYLAQYAGELLTLIFEEQDPHPILFDDLEALLGRLDKVDEAGVAESIFLLFLLRLLWTAGLFPELCRCASCGKPPDPDIGGHPFFSPSAPGVLCADCELTHPDRIAIDPQLIRLLRGIAAAGLPRTFNAPLPPLRDITLPPLTPNETNPLHRILLAHLQHATGKRAKMAEYIISRD